MSARKIRVRQEDRSAAFDYLKKAKDNYEAMLLSYESNNYNAVGTLAVQCAISSADAICVHEKGIRSMSQDHGDISELIESIFLPDSKIRFLSRIWNFEPTVSQDRYTIISYTYLTKYTIITYTSIVPRVVKFIDIRG